MEGNASVHQVYPVSRITGEGRADLLRAWGSALNKREQWGTGRVTTSARGNYKSFEGTNMTVAERMHQIIMYVL